MSGSNPRVNPPSSNPLWSGRQRGRGRWYAVSLALHLVALVVLLYFTPIRKILTEPIEPTHENPTLSASQLEDLTDTIEMKASDALRQNVETLDIILGQIYELQSEVGEEFVKFDAERTQTAAEDALQEMKSAVEKMEEAEKLLKEHAATEEVDRAQALAEQAQERAQNKLAQVPYDVTPAQTEHAKAQETHLAAKEAFNERLKLQDLETLRQSRVDASKATLEKRKEALEATKAKPNIREPQIKQAEKGVTDEEERLATLEKELKESRTARAADEPKASQAQQKAVEAQKQAIAKLEKVIERQPKTVAGSATVASKRPESPRTETMDAPALYDTAKATEDKVAEVFKEVRAMDLAMVRDMKLEDARDDIDVVRPQRPKLNAELLREAVRTETQFEAAKEELKTALRETASMVDLASRMLEMAQQSVEGMKFGAEAAAMPEGGQPDLQLKIEELAMEDVSGKYSDLSEAMKEMAAAQGGGGGDAGAMGAPPKKSVDFEDMTAEEKEAAALAQLRLQEKGASVEGMPALKPEMATVGSRKIKANGEPAEWMYVDTWYTLGPFPNPNRVNIDREFPPDSIIDLDASYLGKSGRAIRWKFVQSENAQVIPADAEEYGIWYAYTELYFDEACDVIIALGTDDRGILKINGVPVWISSKRLKAWDVDEVWRKVHFNKGVNRLLFRVENGWQNIAFSLGLRMAK